MGKIYIKFIFRTHWQNIKNFTTKIYSPTISSAIYLLIVDSNNNTITNLNVTVPQNDNFTKVELTSQIVENATKAYFHFGFPQSVFIDELNANIQ